MAPSTGAALQLKSAVTLCELAPRPSLHGPSQRHTVRCSATYLWLFVSCLPTLYAVFIATMLVWSCRSSATASPTMRTHASPPAAGAAPPRHYFPTDTNVQERILRPRSNFTAAGAPILRRCGKTGWRCGPPVEMLTSSRNWTNRRCAQIRPHHTSQRRHRTHRVVRPHAEDTPRLYARRLRRRVSKRSAVL